MGRSYRHETKENKMKTVIEHDEHRGLPFIKIFEVKGKEGEQLKSERPVIQFGLKKAKAILASVTEIEKFVKDQESKS